ncbi:MAG: type 4a pilus biogenesis protein PilO [Myxococcales bacterium]|nr:type 4a pilus biogenesis protein PilO [Myxococcales bacterium]MCB9519321.1 type 4a pilus biogenesis protein PilO [Myxococcales bacterium]MCB9530765.1 type 4a pilus biogenesis protein PilO [Myxococcales bacterium]MCB9533341.1 type 4a pilus biogenesis protein PilO [Myxococcales bacterium]
MGDLLDQLDKTTTVQKVLLLVLLMLGIGVGYFMLYYTPIQAEITSAEQNVQTLSDRRASLSSGNDLEQIRADIEDLCVRRAAFLEKLPQGEQIPSLLQSINQQAQLTGLTISLFRRETNVVGPRYTTIPVSISLKGTYDQLSDFFYFVGRQQRIVNISNIALRMPAAGAGWRLSEGRASADELSWFNGADARVTAPQLTVTCKLQTYFVGASSASGGGACAD